MKNTIGITLALGVLSIIAMILSFLALTDIAHGEPDLTLEWGMLQLSFFVVVVFHIAAMFALVRISKNL